MRELVYRKSMCRGAVSIRFFVEGTRVIAEFDDGDISSSSTSYELRGLDNKYEIGMNDSLSTPLDTSLGKRPDENKTYPIAATNEKDAKAEFIDFLVKPYEGPTKEHCVPVVATELRAGLMKKLLS